VDQVPASIRPGAVHLHRAVLDALNSEGGIDLAARTCLPSGANASGAFDESDAELRRLIRQGFEARHPR
jgi:hypothetical protein